jgi:hypothetical protein
LEKASLLRGLFYALYRINLIIFGHKTFLI